MSFRERLLARVRGGGAGRRIVFPEGHDARIRAAAERLESLHIGPVQVLDPTAPRSPLPEVVALLRRRRPDKFPTDGSAAEALSDPMLYAACLVGVGAADVCVGGADRPTGEVIRAALLAVGLAPGRTTASSAFYMARDDRVLTFTDCAVVPEPTAAELAEIALAAARDRRRIVGDEPVVAFLSYSTRGSARGARVRRVADAVRHLAGLGVDFAFDGELQGDAALVPEVAARKAPGSIAAGRANVLVFPDLDSGNIAYKLVQRLGEWTALGPILQGLAQPVADLSRGATVDDIVETTAIAILQGDG
ncbi:MAG TPA: phosphate acyltransferase [Gemmatimonadales bacterium]